MASCARCKRDGVVEVHINVGESEVVMRSCPACEHRSWERDGRLINLADILELASRR